MSGVDKSKPHHAVDLSDEDLALAVAQFLSRRGDIPEGTYNTTLTTGPDGNRFTWQASKPEAK